VTGELPGNIPLMVRAARVAAERLGYQNACDDATGMLLHVLASQFTGETIGEIGGGCGVGTAWIASGLTADTRLFTIDNNEAAVASARSQFNDHSQVEILLGDWPAILVQEPFAMLFVDVDAARNDAVDDIVDALRPGGLAVIRDLTPLDRWPEEWRGRPDRLHHNWLEHPRLRSVEVMVTPDSSVILATRRR
jgi:predicted O-methyltransferase YrrM